jgi:hypothetical protein
LSVICRPLCQGQVWKEEGQISGHEGQISGHEGQVTGQEGENIRKEGKIRDKEEMRACDTKCTDFRLILQPLSTLFVQHCMCRAPPPYLNIYVVGGSNH